MTLGDSLRRKIDQGLARSTYGAVILSPNFFEKKWPQYELDGLVSREIGEGKVILPIWHKVDDNYIARFSPPLANKVSVSTDKGLSTVVKEILRVIRPTEIGENLLLTTTPNPTSVSVIQSDSGDVEVILAWTYSQGEITADRFIIFQSRGTPLTPADHSQPVEVTSRTFRCFLPRGTTQRFGIAAARGPYIGPIIQPLVSPDWKIAT